MTHYTTIVRLPADIEGIDDAIISRVKPYDEGVSSDSPYSEFFDETERLTKEYENSSVDQILLDGKHYFIFDRELIVDINKKLIGTGEEKKTYFRLKYDEDKDFIIKAGGAQVSVPYKELYKSFHEFATQYHGYVKNGEHYGYFRNPNAKWDWYVVGGRWSGYFPVLKSSISEYESSNVDIIRIKDIDFDKAKSKAQKHLRAFRKLYEMNFDKSNFFDFYYRSVAFDVGLISVVSEEELSSVNDAMVIKWQDGKNYEIVKNPEVIQDVEDIILGRLNPINASTFLSDTWVEPGKIGWFGSCSANKDSYREYIKKFNEFITSGDPNDWVVLLDCHV